MSTMHNYIASAIAIYNICIVSTLYFAFSCFMHLHGVPYKVLINYNNYWNFSK